MPYSEMLPSGEIVRFSGYAYMPKWNPWEPPTGPVPLIPDRRRIKRNARRRAAKTSWSNTSNRAKRTFERLSGGKTWMGHFGQ